MSCNTSERTSQVHLHELFVAVNAVPSIMALLGNTLTMYVILWKRELRTSHNLLVAGLSFTDLTTTVLSQIPSVISSAFPISHGYCILSAITTATSIGSLFSSILILVMISYERYRCVSSEILRQSMTIRRSCIYLAIVWMMGTAIALVFHFWQNSIAAQMFVPYLLCSVGFVCFCYWKVSGKVKSKERSLRPNISNNNARQCNSYERSQRIYMRKVFLVLCSMILSLFPLLVAVVYELVVDVDRETMFQIYTWAGSLFYFSGAVNPFIYGWMNQRIGMEMKRILHSVLSCNEICLCRNPRGNQVDGSSYNVGTGES